MVFLNYQINSFKQIWHFIYGSSIQVETFIPCIKVSMWPSVNGLMQLIHALQLNFYSMGHNKLMIEFVLLDKLHSNG